MRSALGEVLPNLSARRLFRGNGVASDVEEQKGRAVDITGLKRLGGVSQDISTAPKPLLKS